MGCTSSTQYDTEIIESERKLLSSNQNQVNTQNYPFDFYIEFSQGIKLSKLKKEIVAVNQPCQIIDEDPIFQIHSNLDSNLGTNQYVDSHFNSSLNQSRSSQGILVSQRDINQSKKNVSIEFEELLKHQCELVQKNKRNKRKKSLYKR